MKQPHSIFVAIVTLLLLAGKAFTADEEPTEKPAKETVDSNQTNAEKAKEEKRAPAAKPKVHKVERKTLELKVTLNGVLESSRMKEVAIATKSWGEFIVLDALPQGTEVKKGESLVTLDTEKIDDKIRGLRQELDILEIDRQIAKTDLKLADIINPMELAALERRNKETKEDLARYLEIHRPFNEKAAAFTLKSYQDSLAYAQEELRQLKKMYEADDLTEETEEIILQRAENAVAKSKFSLEAAKIRNEQTLRFEMPREDVAVKEAAKRNDLVLQATRKTKPAGLEKRRLEAKKLDHQREKAVENLARLEQDRKTMKVTSPAAGIVYRGTFHRGKWSGGDALKNRLRRGGALKPHEVFMTIVNPRPLFMRTTLNENDLRRVKQGTKGKVKTVAYPELKLVGTIREISAAPVSPGKFDVTVDIPLPKDAEMLLPGMSCKIELVSYRKEKALVVPSSAVFAEEDDSDSHYVYLHREGKKPIKRTIEAGETSGGQTEILAGLKRGQEIRAEKPKK